MAAVQCTGLTKRFGELTALRDLDLEVPAGQVFGFIGPNGAGKSTTIRMLVGLSSPTTGRCRVLGSNPFEHVASRHRIGYLPGELRLDDRLTVGQTLDSWSRIRGNVSRDYRQELVDRFELDERRPTLGLSTGNRRKVGLVGAFMSRPELLILDEPTNGLDPLMQQVFLALVEETRADDRTVFLSSHILSEVERVADSVALLRHGRLIMQGGVDELRRNARQLYTIKFSHQAPLTELIELAGPDAVTMQGSQGTTVTVDWGGSPDGLLQLLGEHSIESLIAPEVDLEHSFLKYYESEQEKVDASC